MSLRKLAVAGVAAFALAGCGGGGSPGGQTTATSGGSSHTALVDAAKCMREHGYPDYPDPVETNGAWAFPPAAANMAPKPAAECVDLFRQAGALPGNTRKAVTADEMTKLRKWAECIRTNGLPEWPDPESDGVFRPKPAPPAEDDPRWQKADTACRSLEPGPISVDAGTAANKGGG